VKIPAKKTLAPPKFAGVWVPKDVTGLTPIALRGRFCFPQAQKQSQALRGGQVERAMRGAGPWRFLCCPVTA